MKIRYILSLLTVAFLLGSCATPKVAYFTDLKRGTAEQVLNPLEIRIRPEDKISIQVNSKDPLLMNLFNLPIISRQIGTTSGTSNSQGISGYTINKDGDIDFPVLGHIHVAGMTRAEIDLTIDLQKSTPVSSVSLTVNVSKGAAVMDATGLEVWCSEDGKEYRKLASASYPVLDKEDKDGIYPHTLSFSVVETRYVRIIARVTPKLPAWHMWPGNPAFLFVDEVCVK